jgi:hypothetical protein
MNHEKIIKKDDGTYRVYCPRIEVYRDSHDCKTCSRFSKIDPVKGEIVCREQK